MSPHGRPTRAQAVVNRNNTQSQIKRRERVMKEQNRLFAFNDSAWDQIKKTQWDVNFPSDVRPSTHSLCPSCLPTFGRRATNEKLNAYPFLDVTKTARKSFVGVFSSFLESLNLRASTHKLDDSSILKDENVLKILSNDKNISESSVMCLLKSFKKCFSSLKLRIFFWLFSLFLKSNFRAVCVNKGQIHLLKNALTKNNLAFFCLHRSSLDLPIIALTLAKNGLRLPVGVVEEEVDSAAIRQALQGLGCILSDKWKSESDPLYQAVQDSCLTEFWASGSDAIVFPEGRISNTGKPHVGRGKSLYLFSKCYKEKKIQDAQIVPVSVSYDKTIDDYLTNKSTWSLVFRLWYQLAFSSARWGLVRVNFGRPYSIHDMMLKLQKSTAVEERLHMSVSSIVLNEDESAIDRFSYTVHDLTRHWLYDCSRLSPVMATQAVAFLLISKEDRQSGMTMSELISSLNRLRTDLKARSVDTGFTGDTGDVVSFALDVLGKLVDHRPGSEVTFFLPSSLPELAELYRLANAVILHFSLEAVLGRVLTPNVCDRTTTNVKVADTAYDLCQILQFEFVFTPTCEKLEDAIFEKFGDFVTSGALKMIVSSKNSLPFVNKIHFLHAAPVRTFVESDEEYFSDEHERPVFQSTPYEVDFMHEKLRNFSGLLKPVLDVYSGTVSCLDSLGERDSLFERALITRILHFLKDSWAQGMFSRGESISAGTVLNCLRLLEKWRVVDVQVVNCENLYFFTSAYNKSNSMGPIYEKISKFA